MSQLIVPHFFYNMAASSWHLSSPKVQSWQSNCMDKAVDTHQPSSCPRAQPTTTMPLDSMADGNVSQPQLTNSTGHHTVCRLLNCYHKLL